MFLPATESDYFGYSTLNTDLNGDGLNDLIIGAPYYGYSEGYGCLYVFWGSDSFPSRTVIDLRERNADITIYGPHSNAMFALYLAAGDVNGDGIQDLGIAASAGYNPDGLYTGACYFLFGCLSFPTKHVIDLREEPLDLVVYGKEYSGSGSAIAMADFNGDGIDDIAIGAGGERSNDISASGAAYVIFGSDILSTVEVIELEYYDADLHVLGSHHHGNLGGRISYGYINKDEYADLLVSAVGAHPNGLYQSGETYVIYGASEYSSSTLNLLTEQADLTFQGHRERAFLGNLGKTGDFNGDGIDEIAIGAIGYEPYANEPGRLNVVFGSDSFQQNQVFNFTQTNPDMLIIGDEDNDAMGSAYVIDDINCDGSDELIIGAAKRSSGVYRSGAFYILNGGGSWCDESIIDFSQVQPDKYIEGASREDLIGGNGSTGDVNGDDCPDFLFGASSNGFSSAYMISGKPDTFIVAGPGPGPDNPPEMKVYFSTQQAYSLVDEMVYGVEKFGLNVSTGDIDGDGTIELITGPGPGPPFGPQVRAYELNGDPVADNAVNYFAYGTLKYGVNVAAGDIDGDGRDEILTGAGPGAVFGPHVRAWSFDGSSVSPLSDVSYFAYGTLKYGVNVCCGDVDGDGIDEIITGAGPGTVFGPHVRGWNYDGDSILPISGVSFFAYGTNQWGVNVACGDIDGDGVDEIVTGPGPGQIFGAHVRAWDYSSDAVAAIQGVSYFAYDTSYGVNVACGDLDGDGIDEILTAPGPDADASCFVRGWNYDGEHLDAIESIAFYPFDAGTITYGGNVSVD